MRATAGPETTITATITGTAVLAEAHGPATDVVFSEARPTTLAEADLALAAHGLGRTQPWDLGDSGTLTAPVEQIDNRFNGTVAARLDQAIGTTHGPLELALAREVNNGDIITDHDRSALVVVAGCSLEGSTMKIHQVGEGQTWNDRYTGHFGSDQPLWVARRTS